MAKVQYMGTGRRKKSVARVRLVPGNGKVVINNREIETYFGLETLRMIVNQPLVLTGTKDKFDVLVNVHGGGFPRAIGAEKAIDLSCFNVKRQIGHGGMGAIPLGEIFHFNQKGSSFSRSLGPETRRLLR